jgi:2,3-dihydroxy-2,3-dihydrophenylpropionate dehydrogenase
LHEGNRMGWLEEQVVLVTGGGSGLGRAIVARFIGEGARVGVLERAPEKIRQLEADFGDKVIAVHGDVAELADNERAVREAVAKFGRLDCFIGNAGIWDFSMSVLELPAERIGAAFDEIFAINVKALLFGAKAAVPALLATSGNMIFTLSNAALYPSGGGPLYTSSKHAAVGLLRQLAYELAPRVRVNGVAPSGFASDLRGPAALGLQGKRMLDLRSPQELATVFPLEFLPEAADYAGQYVLLASRDHARTTTGAIIAADLGLGIRGIRRPNAGLCR